MRFSYSVLCHPHPQPTYYWYTLQPVVLALVDASTKAHLHHPSPIFDISAISLLNPSWFSSTIVCRTVLDLVNLIILIYFHSITALALFPDSQILVNQTLLYFGSLSDHCLCFIIYYPSTCLLLCLDCFCSVFV